MTIVRKEYSGHYVRLKAVGDQGIVTAVVSVFGNVDLQGDRVMPGAFTTSLARWRKSGDRIPVVWSHEWQDPMSHIGYVTEAQELTDGLLVTSQFDVTANPRAAYIFQLLKDRRLTNWSFAYDIVAERTAEDGAHELLELDIIEVGPTLRGANPETYTLSAKTSTTSNAPVYVNWHKIALNHEAADLKRREALKYSPAYWNKRIDEAASGDRSVITDADREATEALILETKQMMVEEKLAEARASSLAAELDERAAYIGPVPEFDARFAVKSEPTEYESGETERMQVAGFESHTFRIPKARL